jgi:hypothetical protein
MLLLASGLCLPGCGLLYRNSFEGPSFTLYSDRKPEFLATVGAKVARIYEGYEALFDLGPDRLGTTTIVLEGDDTDVIDYGYAPNLLGYYIPLFNYISIDTACAWTLGEEMLDQILLHEVSHHFIVTGHHRASKECWLNEGLAGALEVSVFDDDSFEHPLLNPLLYQLARRTACSDPERLDLKEFLSLSWGEFHDKESKEVNYALAWSIVYFLLERHLPAEKTLGERIAAIYRMDRNDIAALERQWIAFLRGFDITRALVGLARDPSGGRRLTSRWAASQLGNLKSVDDLAALEGLSALFEDADQVKRVTAFRAFLKTLERSTHSFVLSHEEVRGGIDRLEEVLRDPSEPPPLREALAVALGESVRTRRQWLPGLVSLLDGDDGGLRAAAARTLSRIAPKPTIVNPSFWVRGAEADRGREAAEWRSWLASQDG